MDRRLTSTTFGLSGGPTTEDQLRAVWLKVSRVPDIGAIAFEVRDEGTTMILKHKESVVPDRVALRAAVRAAGPYDLV